MYLQLQSVKKLPQGIIPAAVSYVWIEAVKSDRSVVLKFASPSSVGCT